MTDYRAVAAVTAALSERISDAVNGVLPMTSVTNLRPARAVVESGSSTVNVFLYRAVPNPSLRSVADPVRDASGRVIRQPTAAWDLHYLVTFVGDEAELEPDLMLGATITDLTARATLERGFVAGVDAALAAESGNRRFAAGSGLGDEAHVVRLTPLDVSLETMVQLWSSLTKEPYALSVLYEAAVVVMSAKLAPSPPLAVGSAPAVRVAPLGAPRITSVRDSRGTGAILIDSTLVIEGSGLASAHVRVRIGTLDVDVPSAAVTPTRIELALSPDDGSGTAVPRDLAPGVMGVQVRHLIDVGTDPLAADLRPGPTSNTLPIVLRPRISAAPVTVVDADGDPAIAVVIAPKAAANSRYALLLNELGASSPRALLLEEWSLRAATSTPAVAAAVLFKCTNVPAGVWLVRIEVNGADSLLATDASGAYAEPQVTI